MSTTTFAINLSEISRRVAQIVQSVENNVNLGGYLDLQEKSSCVDLVTDVDKKVESFLEKELAKDFPEFKFIGEESYAAAAAPTNVNQDGLDAYPTWMVDPIGIHTTLILGSVEPERLDGTTNFIHGYPMFSCSVALLINKEPLIGVVYNYSTKQTFRAVKGEGAFLNEQKIIPKQRLISGLEDALVITEFGSNLDHLDIKFSSVKRLTKAKVRGIRCVGSAALNLCLLAMGSADIYWEIGIHSWDIAAGVLILTESGGSVFDGAGTWGQPLSLLKPLDLFGRRLLAVRAGIDDSLAKTTLSLLEDVEVGLINDVLMWQSYSLLLKAFQANQLAYFLTSDSVLFVTRLSHLAEGPLEQSSDVGSLFKGINHWRITFDNIDFDIQDVELNNTGSIIALIGARNVAVAALPYFELSSAQSNETVVSAKTYFVKTFAAPKKIIWHPLSKNDTHLCILSSDNVIRIYNIEINLEWAEQSFPLFQQRPRYSADEEALTVSSFCLGVGENTWSRLCMYILMENGDVYCICPVVPLHCSLPDLFLKTLQQRTAYQESKSGFSLYHQQLYASHAEWLQTILTYSADEREDDSIEINLTNAHEILAPAIQGPLLLKPSPHEPKITNPFLATQIYCLNTDVVNVVVIQYEGYKVDLCLDLLPIEPAWNTEMVQEASLFVYETILFSEHSGPTNVTNGVLTFDSDSSFIFTKSSLLYQVSWDPWVNMMKTSYLSSSSPLNFDLPSSISLNKLPSNLFNSKSTVVGLVNLTFLDPTAGKELILFSKNAQFFTLSLQDEVEKRKLSIDKSFTFSNFSNLTPEGPLYQTCLGPKLMEIPALLLKPISPSTPSSLEKGRRINYPKKEDMKLLADKVSQLEKDMNSLLLGTNPLEIRINMQLREQERQFTALERCEHALEQQKNHAKLLHERIAFLGSRSELLHSRLGRLVQLILERSRKTDLVDDAEKPFVRSIQEKDFKFTNEQKEKLLEIKRKVKQLSMLGESKQRMNRSRYSLSGFGTQQLNGLRSVVLQNSDLLEYLDHQLEATAETVLVKSADTFHLYSTFNKALNLMAGSSSSPSSSVGAAAAVSMGGASRGGASQGDASRGDASRGGGG